MRLFLLVVLTMVAFAANSLLTRAALFDHAMDPGLFAVVRTLSGALMLGALALPRLRHKGEGPHWSGPLTLALYMIGFSLAYQSLDAGIGALILFGGVQVTMFAGAVFARELIPARRWIGALISLIGLAVLVWPSDEARVSMAGLGFMALAALGWGLYSLAGRGARDPLRVTALNFLFAVPLVLPLLGLGIDASGAGLGYAIAAGAITSGLGYALWYQVLPQLRASQAALSQLSVPVLAALGGAVLLGESPDPRLWIAGSLVIGGIAAGLAPERPRAG